MKLNYAKFPNDRYIDVVNASEGRDEEALKLAIKNLKDEVLKQAKSISEKYIEPPITTEFAIMFLPTEGLYAECLRIRDLADVCQKDYNVLLAGPTTITALINSFSIGFKFLQVNKNSKEIAKILQAIKVQYGRFEEEIDKTKKSLESATRSTDQLAKRNQMITSKLKSFDEIGIGESDSFYQPADRSVPPETLLRQSFIFHHRFRLLRRGYTRASADFRAEHEQIVLPAAAFRSDGNSKRSR